MTRAKDSECDCKKVVVGVVGFYATQSQSLLIISNKESFGQRALCTDFIIS